MFPNYLADLTSQTVEAAAVFALNFGAGAGGCTLNGNSFMGEGR